MSLLLPDTANSGQRLLRRCTPFPAQGLGSDFRPLVPFLLSLFGLVRSTPLPYPCFNRPRPPMRKSGAGHLSPARPDAAMSAIAAG